MKVVLRREAKAAGLTRYFTGKPCPRGHVVERMTSSGRCHQCTHEDKMLARREDPSKHKDYMARWHAANKDQQWRWRKENADLLSENSRRWRLENAERHAENARRWRLENLELCNENRRKWRRENPERASFLGKRWRENNPEKQRTIMFNRNSATRGVKQAIEHGHIDEMLKSQNGVCVYCGSDISKVFHVDHIMPISKGGGNEKENLQLLCAGCNLSKGAKTESEFLEWMGRNKNG